MSARKQAALFLSEKPVVSLNFSRFFGNIGKKVYLFFIFFQFSAFFFKKWGYVYG